MKLGLYDWIAVLVQHSQSQLRSTLEGCTSFICGGFFYYHLTPYSQSPSCRKTTPHVLSPALCTLLAISPVCVVQGCLLSCLSLPLSPHMWSPSASLSVLCVLRTCTLHFPSPSGVGHWCMNKPPPLLPEALHFSPLTVTPSVSIYHHFPTCLTSVTEPFFFVANWEFHYQCQTY